jgi:hypothetical protein
VCCIAPCSLDTSDGAFIVGGAQAATRRGATELVTLESLHFSGATGKPRVRPPI